MAEAALVIPEKVSSRIIPAEMAHRVDEFRIRRRIRTDQDAVRALIELGLSADHRARRSPVFPKPPEVSPAWPRRMKRAFTAASRAMREAACYGARPLPARLQLRLLRADEELCAAASAVSARSAP